MQRQRTRPAVNSILAPQFGERRRSTAPAEPRCQRRAPDPVRRIANRRVVLADDRHGRHVDSLSQAQRKRRVVNRRREQESRPWPRKLEATKPVCSPSHASIEHEDSFEVVPALVEVEVAVPGSMPAAW